ncbi:MAG: aminopeptidase N, partial [Thermodesulfobacteriota bacterium]
GVEGVIAHEYFHNWTGNRVTCRDWFQLSLKEGLTVFRDQEFSADMNSRPVQRIDDVKVLRTYQFREDSGPMAHPVRPDSYVEINNFYTVTVYNKGAEVIRMMHTLLGREGFRRGMDLYFERHDGCAVTCDDFVAAMADGSGVDLELFKNWYSQSGTPRLKVEESWDEEKKIYSCTIYQSCPPTPGQDEKKPFHIPVDIALLGADGKELENSSWVLELKGEQLTFSRGGLVAKPLLSVLRSFSAPVIVESYHSREELCFLMAHDSDLFNRWEAANQLSETIILEAAGKISEGEIPALEQSFVEAVRLILVDDDSDPALLARALSMPAETTLAQKMAVIEPAHLHLARQFVRKQLALQLETEFLAVYEKNNRPGEYSLSPEEMGRRSLKNSCLSALMVEDSMCERYRGVAMAQYRSANNMTDRLAAFLCFMNDPGEERSRVIDDFYNLFKDDPLVMDKWLSLQAGSNLAGCLEEVKALEQHKIFSMANPNKVRALIGAFVSTNHYRFHEIDGSGYRFLGERILQLNKTNPQIAARLVTPFTAWRRYDETRQKLMQGELERIAGEKELSPDVYELVQKSLKS